MRGTKTSVIDIIGGTVRAGKGLSALLLLTIAGSVLLALLPPLVLERIVDALAGGERVAFSLAAGAGTSSRSAACLRLSSASARA